MSSVNPNIYQPILGRQDPYGVEELPSEISFSGVAPPDERSINELTLTTYSDFYDVETIPSGGPAAPTTKYRLNEEGQKKRQEARDKKSRDLTQKENTGSSDTIEFSEEAAFDNSLITGKEVLELRGSYERGIDLMIEENDLTESIRGFREDIYFTQREEEPHPLDQEEQALLDSMLLVWNPGYIPDADTYEGRARRSSGRWELVTREQAATAQILDRMTWINNQTFMATELVANNPVFEGFMEQAVTYGRDNKEYRDAVRLYYEKSMEALGYESTVEQGKRFYTDPQGRPLTELGKPPSELEFFQGGIEGARERQEILDTIPPEAAYRIPATNILFPSRWVDKESDGMYLGANIRQALFGLELPSSLILLKEDENFNPDVYFDSLVEAGFMDKYLTLLPNMRGPMSDRFGPLKNFLGNSFNPDHFHYRLNTMAFTSRAQAAIDVYKSQRSAVAQFFLKDAQSFIRDSFIASPDAVVDILFLGATLGTGSLATGLKVAANRGIALSSRAGVKAVTRAATRAAIEKVRYRTMQAIDVGSYAAPWRWADGVEVLAKKTGLGARLAPRTTSAGVPLVGNNSRALGRFALYEFMPSAAEELGAAILNERYLTMVDPDKEGISISNVLMEGAIGGFMGVGINRVFRGINKLGMRWAGGIQAYTADTALGQSATLNRVGEILTKSVKFASQQGLGGYQATYAQNMARLGIETSLAGVNLNISTIVVDADGNEKSINITPENVEDHPLLIALTRIIKYDPSLMETTTVELKDPDTGKTIKLDKSPRFVLMLQNAVESAKDKAQAEAKDGEPPKSINFDEVLIEVINDVIQMMPPDQRIGAIQENIKNAAVATNILEVEALKIAKIEGISIEAARKQVLNSEDRILVAIASVNPELQAQITEQIKDTADAAAIFDIGDPDDKSTWKERKTDEAQARLKALREDPDIILEASKALINNMTERTSLSQQMMNMTNKHFGDFFDGFAKKWEVKGDLVDRFKALIEDIAPDAEAATLEARDFTEGAVQLLIELPSSGAAIPVMLGNADGGGPVKTVTIKLDGQSVDGIGRIFNLLMGREVESFLAGTGKKPIETGDLDGAEGEKPKPDTAKDDDPIVGDEDPAVVGEETLSDEEAAKAAQNIDFDEELGKCFGGD